MEPDDALNLVIESHGLTVADIARASEIHPTVISRYRHGRSDLSSRKLFKIVRALPFSAQIHFLALTAKAPQSCEHSPHLD